MPNPATALNSEDRGGFTFRYNAVEKLITFSHPLAARTSMNFDGNSQLFWAILKNMFNYTSNFLVMLLQLLWILKTNQAFRIGTQFNVQI